MAETKQFTPFSPAEIAALEALDPPIDAPTPYGANALPTFEIALVLAGAVSAGAYTAGVLDYLLETLDLWEAEKARLTTAGVPLDEWTVPPHAVRLRVVSGASAGSICAALLGIAARYRFAPATATASAADKRANLFYRAWVEDIDILPLLGTSDLAGAAPPLTSLLDSAPLEAILADALDFSAPPAPPRPFFGSSLAVFMTLSNLRGVPYNFPLTGTPGLVYGASRHADAVRFRIVFDSAAPVRPDEVAVTGTNRATHADWRRVGDVALASAAFPIGLKPRRLDRPTVHYSWLPYIRYFDATPTGAAEPLLQPVAGSLHNALTAPGYAFVNIDGGVMNNEPFELARRELAGLTGSNVRDAQGATRAVVLVDPFPDMSPDADVVDPDIELPATIAAMFDALKNQTRFSTSDLDLLADERVRSRFVLGPARIADGALVAGSRAIAGGAIAGFAGFLDTAYRSHDFMLGRANAELFVRNYFVLPRTNPLFASGAGNPNLGSAAAPHAFNAIAPETSGSYEACIIPRIDAVAPPRPPAGGGDAGWLFDQLATPSPRWPGSDTGLDLGRLDAALNTRINALLNVAGARIIAGSQPAWLFNIGLALAIAFIRLPVKRLVLAQVRAGLVKWGLLSS